jgi:hypothetical protein
MRLIADEDKDRIEMAIRSLDKGRLHSALRMLLEVLANMAKFEAEKPYQIVSIRLLSEAEMRIAYPERFTGEQA